METPRIVTISGADGSGKTTIARAQINWHSSLVALAPSTTTRSPRPSDIAIGANIEYEHLTEVQFSLFEQQHRFFWTEEHGGTRYGTRKEVVRCALEEREKITLAILTPRRVLTLKENTPPGSVFSIFIVSWPYRNTLAERLRSRGEDEAAIQKRLAASEEWDAWALTHYEIFDRFITNDRPDGGVYAAEYVRTLLVSLHKNLMSPR